MFGLKQFLPVMFSQVRRIGYSQGQTSPGGVREYFYYIDHQGQLFLDDARMKNFTSCFKDKSFLRFFYKRLKLAPPELKSPYLSAFPFISPCMGEMNYVRCDDIPYVFTGFTEDKKNLIVNNCGDLLTFPFDPSSIFMLSETGRVYHAAPKRVGNVGLIKSSIAIELSKKFIYHGDDFFPCSIDWEGQIVLLHRKLELDLRKLRP